MSLGGKYYTVWRCSHSICWTSYGVIYRAVWGCPQDVTYFNILSHITDVIFQRPKDVGRGRPQDVGKGRPLVLHKEPYGDVH